MKNRYYHEGSWRGLVVLGMCTGGFVISSTIGNDRWDNLFLSRSIVANNEGKWKKFVRTCCICRG